VGEKEVEKDLEAKAKVEAKKLDLWLSGFTATYKELRSDRHTWQSQVGIESYSEVIRFYAAVGDIHASIQIYQSFGKASPQATRDIILALVHQGKASEALQFKHADVLITGGLAQALVAAHLALDDPAAALEIVKQYQHRSRGLELYHSHFGKKERMKHLKNVVNILEEEGKIKVSEEVKEYVKSFPVDTEDPVKSGDEAHKEQ